MIRHNVSDANGRLDFHDAVSDGYHLRCRVVVVALVDPVKSEIRASRVLLKAIIVRFHGCQTSLELVDASRFSRRSVSIEILAVRPSILSASCAELKFTFSD